MAFITAAIIGGGSLIGGLVGGAMQSSAAQNAAQTQANAANHAADLQYQMFQQQQSNQQPWMQAGQGALTQLQNPNATRQFTMADYQQDPGYQFRLQQGMNAINAEAAASGGLGSGNTLKAAMDYNQGSASNEYQNAYNRFMQNQQMNLGRLQSLAGLGQTSVGQLGQAGQNYADSAGNIGLGAARVQGAAGMAGANAWGGAISGGLNNAGNTWMAYQQMNQRQNWMDQMNPDYQSEQAAERNDAWMLNN